MGIRQTPPRVPGILTRHGRRPRRQPLDDPWLQGAFKIKLSDQADSVIQTEYYNTEKGFVTNNYINVYKIDNQPVFSAREGIFTYNGATNLFARDTLLEKRFGTHEHISYIRQDEKRNIWFVAGNKPALLRWGKMAAIPW